MTIAPLLRSDVARAALAGSLWGALELSVGPTLRGWGAPTGLILAPLGLGGTLALGAGRGGGLLAAAAVAAGIRATTGPEAVSPCAAILLEGAAAQAAFSRFGRPTAWAGVAAVGAALAWDAVHPLVFGTLVTGRSWSAAVARAAGEWGFAVTLPLRAAVAGVTGWAAFRLRR